MGMETLFSCEGKVVSIGQNPITKISQPVPQQREIAETLARHIVKMLS